MSLKTVERVRRDRGFRFPDLIVYGVLAMIIALSFILWFTLRDGDELTGICVYFRDERIFEYDFDGGKVVYADGDLVTVEQSGGETVVNVSTEHGKNTLVINGRSAKMRSADCGGECTYMYPITDNGGVIYCAPHYLRVVPKGYSEEDGYIPVY